ncbi:hypothetical protein MRB53_039870 [Persea americana]|nr:hypothetical protein MRB53_039870 [Persea americana]
MQARSGGIVMSGSADRGAVGKCSARSCLEVRQRKASCYASSRTITDDVVSVSMDECCVEHKVVLKLDVEDAMLRGLLQVIDIDAGQYQLSTPSALFLSPWLELQESLSKVSYHGRLHNRPKNRIDLPGGQRARVGPPLPTDLPRTIRRASSRELPAYHRCHSSVAI